MVFVMKNPYTKDDTKQGDKRNGIHEDNGNVSKKANKVPSALSLVPIKSPKVIWLKAKLVEIIDFTK